MDARCPGLSAPGLQLPTVPCSRLQPSGLVQPRVPHDPCGAANAAAGGVPTLVLDGEAVCGFQGSPNGIGTSTHHPNVRFCHKVLLMIVSPYVV